jgi:hypothetical protein
MFWFSLREKLRNLHSSYTISLGMSPTQSVAITLLVMKCGQITSKCKSPQLLLVSKHALLILMQTYVPRNF